MWRAGLLCAALAAAQPVAAGYATQEALAAKSEALGAHETDHRRHAFVIDDCEVTTFVWEDWEDHGKVLWSSFAFNLAILTSPSAAHPVENFYVEFPDDQDHTMLIFFKTRDGTSARHEMAARRDPKGKSKPSPRQDVDSFVYQEKDQFFFMLENTEKGRARAFVEALYTYQREFCFPIS